VQVQQADQKQKQVRQEDPFMGEMREEPCQPCAFGEAFTQKLLERDGAEAGEGGGKRMTMKIATQASVTANSRKSICTDKS
jgi:hypothetical protein